MVEFEDGKKVYNKLNNLIQQFYNKENLYFKLLDLECFNEYGSEEYLKTLDYIDMVNEYIDELTTSNNEKFDDLLDFLDYLKYHRFEIPYANDTDSIILESDDKIYRRLFNVYFEKGLEIILKAGKKHSDTYIIFKTNYETTFKNQTIKEIIEEDINRNFLTILQDVIEDQNNEDVRYELLNAKYNLIYLNPKLEQELLNNKFKIGYTIPQSSEFYLNLLGVKTSNLFIKLEVLKNIRRELNEILNLKNDDYDYNKAQIIIRSAYLRANMGMLEQKELEFLNEKFYEDLSASPLKNSNSKSKILIADTFSKTLKDKKKYFLHHIK